MNDCVAGCVTTNLVAFYSELPSKELLQRQIHKGLEAARQRGENRMDN